jgi:hypothetical protein
MPLRTPLHNADVIKCLYHDMHTLPTLEPSLYQLGFSRKYLILTILDFSIKQILFILDKNDNY